MHKTLKITEKCGENCLHCTNDSKEKDLLTFNDVKREVEDYCDTITIKGGEPVLHDQFEDIFLFAYENTSLIYLETNMHIIPFLTRYKYNLDKIKIIYPFHTINRHTFNYMLQNNSFDFIYSNIINSIKFLDVHAKIMVTSINYNDISMTVDFLLNKGVKHINLILPDFKSIKANHLNLFHFYFYNDVFYDLKHICNTYKKVTIRSHTAIYREGDALIEI